jgi:hypothetical protein
LQSRRLEDRIHALLTKALRSTDSEELEAVIRELRAALYEQIRRLREMAAVQSGPPRRRGTD